jgi:hypothetical protein
MAGARGSGQDGRPSRRRGGPPRSAPTLDEQPWEDRRRRLGIIAPDWVIAERVAKWHEGSSVQGVIWDLSGSHGGTMTGSTLNWYGKIHTLGELAAKTDTELQAIRRLGPVGMGLVREVLRLWRGKQAARLAQSRHPAARAAALEFPAGRPGRASRRAAGGNSPRAAGRRADSPDPRARRR